MTCLEASLTDFSENKALSRVLEPKQKPRVTSERGPTSGYVKPVRNIDMAFSGRTVTLTGAGVTEAFRARLLDWLKSNA